MFDKIASDVSTNILGVVDLVGDVTMKPIEDTSHEVRRGLRCLPIWLCRCQLADPVCLFSSLPVMPYTKRVGAKHDWFHPSTVAVLCWRRSSCTCWNESHAEPCYCAPQEFTNILRENLVTAFNILKASEAIMVKHNVKGGGITLVSAAASLVGVPNCEAWAAAKAGVEGKSFFVCRACICCVSELQPCCRRWNGASLLLLRVLLCLAMHLPCCLLMAVLPE